MGRYWRFRSDHPGNLSIPEFTAWQENQYGLAHGAAVAYCYPLGPSQFDIAVLADEQIRELAEEPEGKFSQQFLEWFCGDNLEQVPTCLIDTFIVGSMAQSGFRRGQMLARIVEMGFTGGNNAANALRSVGRSVGRHFGLLTDDDLPTERFRDLFGV